MRFEGLGDVEASSAMPRWQVRPGQYDSVDLSPVTALYMCAGFVVQGGRITLCAPILRMRLAPGEPWPGEWREAPRAGRGARSTRRKINGRVPNESPQSDAILQRHINRCQNHRAKHSIGDPCRRYNLLGWTDPNLSAPRAGQASKVAPPLAGELHYRTV
jgi:hypothetical protein